MAKYLFEKEPLTCISLEREMGLNRGDIQAITVYPEGAVEIESIDLTASQRDKVKVALEKKNLPKGKKRETE